MVIIDEKNLFSNERKRYNKIIKLFEQKKYDELFKALFDNQKLKDNMYDTFGFSDKRYIDNVLERFTQELDNNEFKELFFKWLENYTFNKDFSNSELFIMGLDLGFVPTLEFLEESKVLRSPRLAEKLLDIYDSEELGNSSALVGCAVAQKRLIETRPSLLKCIKINSPLFIPIWIEIFKQGYIPDGSMNDIFFCDYVLFSKLIQLKPEMIRYVKPNFSEREIEKFSFLALSMGYVPTINDLKNQCIQNSPKIVQLLLFSEPDAIRFIDQASAVNFQDYARLALNNGYIPTLKDFEQNPHFGQSFDLMKILISKKTELINRISYKTPNQEELLKIAIQYGFKDEIIPKYLDSGYENSLLNTDTAILYQLSKGKKLNEISIHGDNYTVSLYNFFLNKGYNVSDFIIFFNGNFDVMKKIIEDNPEYITFLSNELSRNKIDFLGLLAI